MSGVELWRTPTGRHLIESTLPKLGHQLERLNQTIERLVQALQAHSGAPAGADVAPIGASPSGSQDDAPSAHPAPQARLVAFLEELAAGYARVRATDATGPVAAAERPITAAAVEAAFAPRSAWASPPASWSRARTRRRASRMRRPPGRSPNAPRCSAHIRILLPRFRVAAAARWWSKHTPGHRAAG